MNNYSASSAFEKKTFVGLWWLPNQERKCYGTLSFDIDGEQKLRIIGTFEENFSGCLPEYKVIHGLCEIEKKKKKVTIFQAWVTHISPQLGNEPNVSETIISFGDIWIGNSYYTSFDEVRFSSFSFGLNNLENWLNEHNVFSVNFDSHLKQISAEMKIPDPLPLFSDEYVSISVDYWRQIPGYSMGQTESTMRYCPQIFIKANAETLQYYGDKNSYWFYISLVFQFFELLMSGHTFPFGLYGNRPVPEGKFVQKIHCEMLYSRDITIKQRTEINPLEVLFPYGKISQYLTDLFDKFKKSYVAMGNILEVLCSSLCSTSYTMHLLPNLLFTLEGLQQLFYHSLGEKDSPNNKDNYMAFETQKNAVIARCDSNNLKAFVKKEIAWRVTFRDRLYAILLDVCTIFQFLDKDVCNEIANDLKKIRNAGAHSNSKEPDNLNIHLSLRQIQFVQFLHIAIILKACGLPSKIIKECFENSCPREFQAMSDDLKKYYASVAGETNG